MKIERVWAMPNKWTFKIKPIKKLLERYVQNGKGWMDPFSGMNSPAEYTNDLNPQCRAIYHMEASDFIKQLDGQYVGCIFDPPYSLNKIKEAYMISGKNPKDIIVNSQYYALLKKLISPKIKSGGYVICFGFHSNGFGKRYGFEMEQILLIAHGGAHYDTIVTVERKMNKNIDVSK